MHKLRKRTRQVGQLIRVASCCTFRAPQFWELDCVVFCNDNNVSSNSGFVYNSNEERIPTLFVVTYPELQPEKTKQWTLNVRYSPTFLSNVDINVEYFNIDYFNRIETTLSDLEEEVFAYKEYKLDKEYQHITLLNPNITTVEYFTSLPDYHNPYDIEDGDIKALIQFGQKNLSYIEQRGLNFSLKYKSETFADNVSLRVDGTYLFKLKKKVYEYSPVINEYNKPYRPVDLKLRSSISWKRNRLFSNIAVNYVNSYMDKRTNKERKISSWTTVDLNFRHKFNLHGRLKDISILIGISNLFGKSPPFVRNNTNYNYDATNANAIGRRISIELSQLW